MKLTGIFLLLFCVLGHSLHAQKTQEEFDEMLTSMYTYSVPLISPADMQKQLGSNCLILDTREKGEYQVSHIPNAVWAGYNNFQKKLLDETPKDQPIIVYCSVGYRSERIGEKLKEMGFTNVHNLYGGIFNWSNQGQEMVNKDQAPTNNVHGYNQEWSQWILKGKKVLK